MVRFAGFDGNLGVLVPVFLFGDGGRWRGKARRVDGAARWKSSKVLMKEAGKRPKPSVM